MKNNSNSDELELDKEDPNQMKSLHFGDDRETSRSINYRMSKLDSDFGDEQSDGLSSEDYNDRDSEDNDILAQIDHRIVEKRSSSSFLEKNRTNQDVSSTEGLKIKVESEDKSILREMLSQNDNLEHHVALLQALFQPSSQKYPQNQIRQQQPPSPKPAAKKQKDLHSNHTKTPIKGVIPQVSSNSSAKTTDNCKKTCLNTPKEHKLSKEYFKMKQSTSVSTIQRQTQLHAPIKVQGYAQQNQGLFGQKILNPQRVSRQKLAQNQHLRQSHSSQETRKTQQQNGMIKADKKQINKLEQKIVNPKKQRDKSEHGLMGSEKQHPREQKEQQKQLEQPKEEIAIDDRETTTTKQQSGMIVTEKILESPEVKNLRSYWNSQESLLKELGEENEQNLHILQALNDLQDNNGYLDTQKVEQEEVEIEEETKTQQFSSSDSNFSTNHQFFHNEYLQEQISDFEISSDERRKNEYQGMNGNGYQADNYYQLHQSIDGKQYFGEDDFEELNDEVEREQDGGEDEVDRSIWRENEVEIKINQAEDKQLTMQLNQQQNQIQKQENVRKQQQYPNNQNLFSFAERNHEETSKLKQSMTAPTEQTEQQCAIRNQENEENINGLRYKEFLEKNQQHQTLNGELKPQTVNELLESPSQGDSLWDLSQEAHFLESQTNTQQEYRIKKLLADQLENSLIKKESSKNIEKQPNKVAKQEIKTESASSQQQISNGQDKNSIYAQNDKEYSSNNLNKEEPRSRSQSTWKRKFQIVENQLQEKDLLINALKVQNSQLKERSKRKEGNHLQIGIARRLQETNKLLIDRIKEQEILKATLNAQLDQKTTLIKALKSKYANAKKSVKLLTRSNLQLTKQNQELQKYNSLILTLLPQTNSTNQQLQSILSALSQLTQNNNTNLSTVASLPSNAQTSSKQPQNQHISSQQQLRSSPSSNISQNIQEDIFVQSDNLKRVHDPLMQLNTPFKSPHSSKHLNKQSQGICSPSNLVPTQRKSSKQEVYLKNPTERTSSCQDQNNYYNSSYQELIGSKSTTRINDQNTHFNSRQQTPTEQHLNFFSKPKRTKSQTKQK